MAPRFPRRREEPPEPSAEDDQGADLGASEHAWWAQRELDELWSPRDLPIEDPAPERDILAEHFGPDWRTTFGFDHSDDPASDDSPEDAGAPSTDSDPYAVLQVEPSASWEEIVEAHRRLARRHHPDRLHGLPDAEVAIAEDRIREVNVAYQELRIRRGR